ncbi:hypothetical protein BDM02DRAFT_597496 [Thelephora ganbajun]|uniref:Uncharacterized protein n=1 Tax=Thelephora ganbajun TaxID=370292 RepID=A0ACB6Z713_THEGA|nr:hypothetical protein BDM02DRAFT_597496 [Thelephora ganbajun]
MIPGVRSTNDNHRRPLWVFEVLNSPICRGRALIRSPPSPEVSHMTTGFLQVRVGRSSCDDDGPPPRQPVVPSFIRIARQYVAILRRVPVGVQGLRSTLCLSPYCQVCRNPNQNRFHPGQTIARIRVFGGNAIGYLQSRLRSTGACSPNVSVQYASSSLNPLKWNINPPAAPS